VVIATNGYTGGLTPDLKRRLIPVASHIIATEPLDPALVKSLISKGRTLAGSRRILCYWRLSPDGTRVLFGGRVRFTQVSPEISAPILHRMMLQRWRQLAGVRVTHAWIGNVAFAFDNLPHMGGQRRDCITPWPAMAPAWECCRFSVRRWARSCWAARTASSLSMTAISRLAPSTRATLGCCRWSGTGTASATGWTAGSRDELAIFLWLAVGQQKAPPKGGGRGVFGIVGCETRKQLDLLLIA
jgi:hypothetical protein